MFGGLFSALGNIGKGIGSGVATGAKQTGGMFAKGFEKLRGMNGDGAAPALSRPQLPATGPGGTGGFAGNEGLPQLGGRGLINRSQDMPDRLPQLQRPDAPAIEMIRDGADTSWRPSGQISVSPQQTQMIAERSAPQVRVPDFLAGKGQTMDDTPMNRSRYDYQTRYMDEGKIPRRWQDIAMSALHGAAQGMQTTGDWQGALGGAAAGGIGAGVSPLHARDYRFRQEQMPRLQQQQQESWQLEDRANKQKREAAELRGLDARTNATIAGTKDAALERQYRQSQIAKMDAQAEAAARGKDVTKMIPNPETGELEEVRFFADGTSQVLGKSGQAILKREGWDRTDQRTDKQIKSREGIADRSVRAGLDKVRMQQGGANYRAGLSQSGQNYRHNDRMSKQYGDSGGSAAQPYGPPVAPQGKPPAVGSVPVKRATGGDVQEYARQKGISPDAARKMFEAKGYRVE